VPFLDTNVLVDVMRRRNPARQKAALNAIARWTMPDDPPATSRFTVAELLVGAERSADPDGHRRKIDQVLMGIGLLEFDERAMLTYPKITKHLLDIGRPIGVIDTLIAAVALANDRVLITRNVKHFADITDLRVETY
jgi:tRNA(fMet)-specific endonuclease VapC